MLSASLKTATLPIEKMTQWPPSDPVESFTYWRRACAIHVRRSRRARVMPTMYDRPDFVYFIRCGGGPIKIGVARDPLRRLDNLQCGNLVDLTLERVILAGPEFEAWLHREWKRARVRGEWFGKGFEEDILAHARVIAEEQFEHHTRGGDLRHISYVLPRQIGKRLR